MAGINHVAVKAHGDKGTHTEWNDDHKQKGNHDCEQHQHLNHVLENRTDWPAGPVAGQIIFRSDYPNAFVWTGTMWASLTPVATIVVAADGTGNYTDIQDGIDALPAGGGVVYIKEGTYNISAAIDIKQNNTTLVGAGKSTKIVQTVADHIIDGGDFNAIHIEKILVDGNARTSLSGIRFGDTVNSRIVNCWIEDCGEHGVYIDVSGENVLIHGNNVKGCGWLGIGLLAIIDGIVTNNFVDNVGLDVAGSCGMQLAFTEHSIIANNSCTSASPNIVHGILLGVSYRNVISGNQCVGNSGNGIWVYGSGKNSITDNICLNNSQTAGDTYSGIVLSAEATHDSTHNRVEGNLCRDNQGVKTQKYGIAEGDADQDKNIILGNTCTGNITDQIFIQGPNTEIGHNKTS